MQIEIQGRTFEFTLQRSMKEDAEIEHMFDDTGCETFDITDVVEVSIFGGDLVMLEAGDKIVTEIIMD